VPERRRFKNRHPQFIKGATDMAAKKEPAAKKPEAKKPEKSAKAKPAAKKK
jgi:hypothetical protein